MNYWFSGKNNAFYPITMKEAYLVAGSLPPDIVEVSDAVYAEYSGEPPQGKVRGVDVSGHPVWLDLPPPTEEDLHAEAANIRQILIEQALDYISDKQWQGKAAMGRLKDGEREQYNAWLDYLDALDAVDISAVPDVNWPSSPEK